MRTPSIKTLSAIFGDKAPEAKRILSLDNTSGKLKEYASVQTMRAQCFGRPSQLMVKLCALNELGEFHGAESCETAAGDEYAEYLNAGDCYVDTLIYWRGNFRVQCLGDFIERSRVAFK